MPSSEGAHLTDAFDGRKSRTATHSLWAAAQNQQSAAPSQRRTALNQKEAEEKTEGTDAGPAFAEPEQAFVADLFVTTVYLLDDY